MRDRAVESVVKVGGGLLALPGALDRVTAALSAERETGRIVVVPGGGPFADVVREVCRDTATGDDAAHWMAILAMNQFAHLLASRIDGARIAERQSEVHAALADRRLPVLAPYHWLRTCDPLPHAWEVTSDSIAAWVAGQLGARRVILVKPAAMSRAEAVDAHFARALPAGVEATVLPAAEIGRLGALLHGGDRALPVR